VGSALVGWLVRVGAMTAAGGLALAACGGSETVTVGEDPVVEYRLIADEPLDEDVLEEAAAVLQQRFDAAGIEAEVAPVGGGLDVRAYEGVGRGRVASLARPGDVQFRPVLGNEAARVDTADDPCASGWPGDAAPLDEDAELPQCDTVDGAWLATYLVGPTVLSGDAVERASAVLHPSDQWVVSLTFHDGERGIDTFNEIAAQCVEGTVTCPDGQLAIVMDGVVITAPTINSASFERDQIEISGDFDEQRAADLAAILGSGSLPTALRPS
jgi:preprotein translocase subunit SecD